MQSSVEESLLNLKQMYEAEKARLEQRLQECRDNSRKKLQKMSDEFDTSL